MTAFPFFTEDASVDAVNARIGAGCDPRLALVMARLVHHLHAFVRFVPLPAALAARIAARSEPAPSSSMLVTLKVAAAAGRA